MISKERKKEIDEIHCNICNKIIHWEPEEEETMKQEYEENFGESYNPMDPIAITCDECYQKLMHKKLYDEKFVERVHQVANEIEKDNEYTKSFLLAVLLSHAIHKKKIKKKGENKNE